MKIPLVSVLLLAALVSHAQDPYKDYRIADSLYRAGAYKASAGATMAGIRADKEKDIPLRYRNAAGAYAMAQMPDSAFAALQNLTQSKRASLPFLRALSTNKDFASLRADTRWEPIIQKATKKAEGNYKIEEMVYGRKEGLALTLLQLSPLAKPNGRAIIRVVAGSWYSNYEMAENYIIGSFDYLQEGFKVFEVMVGSQPRFTMAEQVADVKRAVRFIRYNGHKFGINPNKIGIEGASAGGHLALAVAMADEYINEKSTDPVDDVSSRVQAVAALFPPTDLLNWGGNGLNFINARGLLEYNKVWGAVDFKILQESNMVYMPVTDTAARNKIGVAVSPIYAVSPDDPPVFLMHGNADATVPIQQSLSLVEKMKAVGVPHQFINKPGGRHNGNDMLPEWQQAVGWFVQWLK